VNIAARWLPVLWFLLPAVFPLGAQEAPRKIFISVDMEGIGGIGTDAMTGSGGKDYATGRRLMTDEVNAVVDAVFAHGPAEIVVNDSHGDMQNLLHTELDPRVTYIQGNIKPLGMVQGLDASFDGVIFLGYHARAGDPEGFQAHTGSGAVKGLWLDGVEVGEGGLNAAFAGHLGVPVLVAAGDQAFADEIAALLPTRTVVTKVAVTPEVASLRHPSRVLADLTKAVGAALDAGDAPVFPVDAPVEVRVRFATTTRPDILEALPGVERMDGYTVRYVAADMDEAYRLIRLMYKYISW
jgi:D-amino peptidase